MKKIESIKKMSNAKKLLLLGFVIIFLAGCAPDIIVPPPNSLRGFYIGRLYVNPKYSEQGSRTQHMNVRWSFSDLQSTCETEVATGQDLNICDFIGRYALEDGVVFSGTVTNIPETCNDEYLPFGVFSLRWINVEDGNDTLVFDQRINDVYTKAELEKQPDDTED